MWWNCVENEQDRSGIYHVTTMEQKCHKYHNINRKKALLEKCVFFPLKSKMHNVSRVTHNDGCTTLNVRQGPKEGSGCPQNPGDPFHPYTLVSRNKKI